MKAALGTTATSELEEIVVDKRKQNPIFFAFQLTLVHK